MTVRLSSICAAGMLAAMAAAPAQAADSRNAASFDAVLKCRALTDDAQRLACYDAAAGQMGEAEKKGEIVVIDRAQAKAAHREAFGLHVPSLDFVNRALKAEEIDAIDGVVASARADENGKWTIRLEDGATWRQISGDLAKPPRAGAKVRIRKGSIGSFLMNVDDQQSIKVHRVE